MKKETCTTCARETVSVIPTGTGFVCYNCYTEQKNPAKKAKKARKNEEAKIQQAFFDCVQELFPNLPDKLLFAVPNGGSRHVIEASNLKLQGVKRGVADVILLIPKKGYASLCLEFKTSTGKQSKDQKEFEAQATFCKSKYIIVRSVQEAIDELRKYLQ